MRIVMVGPTHPHGGGIVHYTHALCNGLVAAGNEVALLTYTRLFPRWLYKVPPYEGVERVPLDHQIEVKRVLHYGDPITWTKAARWLGRSDADVLHLQVWTPFLVPSLLPAVRKARKLGMQVVATLHNIRPHDASHRRLNWLTRVLTSHCDRVLVHSESLRHEARQELGVPLEKSATVPMGAFESFHAGGADRQAVRARYGFQPASMVILMFGAVRPYKGIDVAIKALARLPPQFELLVAGKAWQDWHEYASLADGLGVAGRVKARLDYIPDDDIEGLYRCADVVALPYLEFDSQSASGLVAATFSLPIVASAVGGLRDLVQDEFLVPPGDPVALARAIERAVQLGGPTVRAGGAPSWQEAAAANVQQYRVGSHA